jgi:DNA invertase Pin-like site-specific DNA recombinase
MVRAIVIKQNLDISKQDINSKVALTLFSLFGDLERDLISLRTKEVLASKKRAEQVLGKPKGTIQKSKFDQDIEKIKELLGYGLSIRKMAKVLGYPNHISLNTYVRKREINVE